MAAKQRITLDRRNVVSEIIKNRGDLLIVSGLGAPTWDVAAAGDHPNNFYLWGGMGGAALIGLGLALAQPARRVLVITGDGEILMVLAAWLPLLFNLQRIWQFVLLTINGTVKRVCKKLIRNTGWTFVQ